MFGNWEALISDNFSVKIQQVLARLRERLRAAGPESALRRGYVIVRDAERRVITSRAQLAPGQKLFAQWHDGEAPVRAE